MKKTLLAVAAAFIAVGAQAATISDSYGLPVVQSTTEITETGALDKFDSSLGTLTGATLNIYGAARFVIGGTNNAAQAQSARLTASTDLAWSSDVAGLNGLLSSAVISLSATTGLQSYAAGQSRTFGPFDASDSLAIDLSSILASLSGAGTFGVTCASLSGVAVVGGGGNIATTQTTTAGCGADIAYTYDAVIPPPPAVPEPASLALVGLALAGVAAASRRRKV